MNFFKKLVPNFLGKRKNLEDIKIQNLIDCHKLSPLTSQIKRVYDIRFSLLIQEMLNSESSISKEALFEVNRFVHGFISEIERGDIGFNKKIDDVSKWAQKTGVSLK